MIEVGCFAILGAAASLQTGNSVGGGRRFFFSLYKINNIFVFFVVWL